MMLRFARLALFGLVVAVIMYGGYRLVSGRSAGGNLERPADQRLLFIGNSFTYGNNLDQLVAQLAQRLNPAWRDVLGVRVAHGGYRLEQHANDVDNAAANPPLRQLLRTGSPQLRDWDLIVVQEQSQIPGFPNEWPDKIAMYNGAGILHKYMQGTNATLMVMMTWGYVDGDPTNRDIYPDYPTMQQRLRDGYGFLAAHMSNLGRQVYVAPVGLGFQLVYDDVVAAGRDPRSASTRFRQLYADDGRHPALPGSYLAACIIVQAHTGQSVLQTDWTPRGLDADYAAYLREVADRVVFGGTFAYRYPWSS